MIINKMDEVLMNIYSIKNIEEIEFSELVPSSNNSDYINLIPCLYVRYDSGKILSLCSQDKYFDIFVKKVIEVYNLEKDKVVEDRFYNPFRVSKLKIDDKTSKILNSGVLTQINDLYCFYEGKKNYDYSLLIESDELNYFLPLITEQLKELYDLTDTKITFNDLSLTGYRKNYTINCKINGIDDILYIKYEKINNRGYYFSIRGKNKDFNTSDMYVMFNKNGINITTSINEYNLDSENEYVVEDNILKNNKRVSLNDKLISYTSEMVNEVNNEHSDITSLVTSDNMKWYKLPWGSLYGVEVQNENISSVERVNNIHTKYLDCFKDNYNLKEYFSRSFHRNKTFEVDSYDLVLDECFNNMNIVYLDNGIYLIETYFSDECDENGYYKTYLDNKYYYHLLEKGKNFNKSNMVSISSDNNIIYGSDLSNNDDVVKLVRGGK